MYTQYTIAVFSHMKVHFLSLDDRGFAEQATTQMLAGTTAMTCFEHQQYSLGLKV